MGRQGPAPGFPVKFLAKCISDHDGEDGPELTTAAEACGDVVFREIHLNLMAVAIGEPACVSDRLQ